jgi:hypothetical protein
MSSTSPSKFMLGYMAKADSRSDNEQIKASSRSNDKIDEKCKHSLVINDKFVYGTYEKMVVSFEEKIGLKLDELMNKYSKI